MEDFQSWWDKGAHIEYPFILAGAHRRRLTPFGAPALVRHLAFWNATPVTGPANKPRAKAAPHTDPRGNDPLDVKLRAIAADQCIAEIYRCLITRLSPDGAPLAIDGLSVPDAVDGLVVLFRGVIDEKTGKPVSIRRRQHILSDSYRAIKFNFRWHGIDTKLNFELHSEYVTMTTVLDLSDEVEGEQDGASQTFAAICKALTDVCDADLKVAEREAHLWRDRLYDWVWDEFSKDILSCLENKIARLGRMFVDFRGLVVRPRPPSEGLLSRFVLPRTMTRKSDGPVKKPPIFCEPADLQRVWPLIHGLGLGRSEPEQERGPGTGENAEYTVSLFLDGRAVYATALGSQASLLTSEAPKPLYYFLYEDTLSAWQLGRLVSRIHRAGTARLAAIMHFGKLRDAHHILGEIETRLEKDIVRDPGDVDELRWRLRKLNDEVEAELVEISDLGLESSLENRVERSRYYVRQFQTTVKSLRIGRVDGYQTYEEFVEQRLSPMFDYIDRLGNKLARIQQDRLLLIGRIQALDSQYAATLIVAAQGIADYGLSSLLGPYYAAYILSHGLSGIAPERSVWLGALFFCPMIVATIRHREEGRGIEDAKRLGRPLAEGTEARYARLSRRLRFLGVRRLTMFFRLAVLAFFLGMVADYVLALWGLRTDTEGHSVEPSLRLLLFALAAIILLIEFDTVRRLLSVRAQRRKIAPLSGND